MTTELEERVARRIAAKQGQETQWPIYVGHAQEALAEVAAYHGIPGGETDLPPTKSKPALNDPIAPADFGFGSGLVEDEEALANFAHYRIETTSPEVASIAARGLSNPELLTPSDIRAVCASALTQVG